MIADQEHVDRCLQRRQCSLSLSLSLDHRERERANRRRPILESSPSRRRYTLTGSTVYHRPRLKLREAEDRESKLHTAISADVRPNHLQSRHQPFPNSFPRPALEAPLSDINKGVLPHLCGILSIRLPAVQHLSLLKTRNLQSRNSQRSKTNTLY